LLDGSPRARLCAVVLAATLLTACGPASESPPAQGEATAATPSQREAGNIILITVDTLRPDHMSLYGYKRNTTPRIDGYFADSRAAVYERSYATETATSPSVVSFLSGLLPQEHRVRLLQQLLPEDTLLVTDYLPERYENAGFVSNAVLTDEALAIASRFDHYDDFVDEREEVRENFERKAGRTTDAVLAWLDRREDADRPLFLWVHYIDPHGPYQPPADWETSFQHETPTPIDPRRVHAYMRALNVTNGEVYVDLYDEEIAYTDREVGRLLDGLDERSVTDEALVMFTADHGEAMMEHEGWFTHAYHVYDEISLVPMMLRGPGVEPGRWKAAVSGIDVASTILDFAGVPRPAALRGSDLRRLRRQPAERVVLTEATNDQRQVRAIIRGDQKLMAFISPEGETLGWKLYDLAEDPGELDPQSPVTAPRLQATLFEMIKRDPDPGGFPAEFKAGQKLSGPKVAPGVDPKQLERLKALGYAE